MSFSNFIPEVWSARLLEHLDNTHVYAALLNRDYEGEIRGMGDTVHINQIGDITIYDYDGSDLPDPENLDGTQQDLVIDQGKAFNLQIKDIDNIQSCPKLMDKAIERAAYKMNDDIDAYLGLLLAGGVAAANVIGSVASPVSLTSSTAYTNLVDLGTKLSEANVPQEGRWAVLTPAVYGLLLKDDRFVSYGTDPNRDALQNGRVGRAAGFEIYVSNNAPHTYKLTADTVINNSKTYYIKNATTGVFAKVGTPKLADIATYYEQQTARQVLAGSELAGTFAEQLVEIEAYRREKNFADGVKGLDVYGAKVVQPKALAALLCTTS